MTTVCDLYRKIIEENPEKSAFYVVDLGKLEKLYEKWIELLPRVKPYYAIKCNSNPKILEVLENLGVNFDCASKDEIQTILDITHDPDRIIFANPCKNPQHIQYAKENLVNLMTFDCEEELYKIKKYYSDARLVLRLAGDDSKSKMKFSKKFGCIKENVITLLVLAKSLQLTVVGFSFHVGSKCMSADTYYYALNDCKYACEIARLLDIKIDMIDIGGGFSSSSVDFTDRRSVTSKDDLGFTAPLVPVKPSEDGFFDAAYYINKGIDVLFSDYPSIQFIAEPGRYFAETTHTLVLQVIGKKVIVENDENIIVYTLNESVYNSFNCVIFDCCVPDITPLNGSENAYKTRIYGHTCDSMDLLLDNVMMPMMEVGDWTYVENFGAYTYSASSHFNGFQATPHFFYI